MDVEATPTLDAVEGICKDKRSFLKLKSVFGGLASDQRFAKVYAEMIGQLYANPDVASQMREIIESDG